MNPWWKIGLLLSYTLFIITMTWRVEAWKYTAADQRRTISEQNETIKATTSVLATERDANKTTNEVSNAYQNRISIIDDQYRAALAGVQLTTKNPASAGLSSISTAQPGYNAPTYPNGLSRRNKEAIIALMHQADVQAATLQACQSWIARHADQLLINH